MEKSPLGLYITQTGCTINAVRRVFAVRIPGHIFHWERRGWEDCDD
jgi:hypothetical protein